jgi:type I restriction enzyme S subunit
MEPYPEYRNPPIKWLHRAPINWEIHRAKYLFKRMNRPVRSSDEIVTAFRDGIVTLRKNRRTEGFTNSLKEIGYQGVRKGDLVIHAMDGFAGAIGVSDSDGKSTPVYSVCVPHYDVSTKYYAYLIRTMALNGYIKSLAKGIRERSTEFRYNEFKNLELIVPTLKEQQSITTFLDRETSRIDALVEKKQQFIELLEERRSALISHAVTKGLDPDVPMKDSGIEWIRQIPEHWDAVKLKYLLLDGKEGIKIGPFGSSLKLELMKNKGYKVYGQENVIKEDFSVGKRFIDFAKYKELQNYEIYPNDILITMMGTTGRTCVVPDKIEKGIMDSHLIRIRTKTGINSSYVSLLINSSNYIEHQIKIKSKGAIMDGLNSSIIKSLLILLPPLKEQNELMEFLTQINLSFDTLIEKTEQSIEFLKEYRTALISSAVTGKIDVRGTVSD